VRAVLCPDKLSAGQWLEVVTEAHGVGLPTTATMMFGHVDTPVAWAKHLLQLRELQAATGGCGCCYPAFDWLAFRPLTARLVSG
jgi:FO synthase